MSLRKISLLLHLLALSLLLLTPGVSVANQNQKVNLDSIYKCIDDAILASPSYVAVKQKTIDRVTGDLRSVRHTTDSLRLCRQLYDEYAPFRNDSALHYIMQCISLATRLGNKEYADECRAIAAYQCSNTGLYAEAQNLLDDITLSAATPYTHSKYLIAASHLSGEIAFYSPIPYFKAQYYSQQGQFNSMIYESFDHADDAYLQRREMDFISAKDFRNALATNDQRIKGLNPDARQFAVVAFYRFLDYTLISDIDMQCYWLAKSSLCDIKNAVMDQAALWELANRLRDKGDIERSQRYITFAWQCAMNFGTRVRSQQITPVLSQVDALVQNEQKVINDRLYFFIIALVVLSIVFLFLLANLKVQHDRLVKTRNELHQSNEQLAVLNSEMHTANQKLYEAVAQTEELNGQLKQAGRLKEEYVGQFMRLCSQYIDRSDDFRKRVHKLLKVRDFDRLYAETSNRTTQEKALSELYECFDTTFLRLFPNFLNDFNALLRPEEQQELEGDHLSTQLRIFALIRLGIDESAKIAEFLHYSVNTIYNYRAKIKNGAIDRENFEQNVKDIS